MSNKLTRIKFAESSKQVEMHGKVLEGALVVTEGEALGHGMWLDSSFCEGVMNQINASRFGIKARFGHPNMCSSAVGTYIGRWKNAELVNVERADGRLAQAVRADLHMSKTAKITPSGNLYDYVVDMAENESDMFATSIVFDDDGFYRKGSDGNNYFENDEIPEGITLSEEPYVFLRKLYGCDVVDEGAANDTFFSRETVAGRMSELLDSYPELVQEMLQDEEVLKALQKHPEVIAEFFNNYNKNKEVTMTEETKEIKSPEIIEKESKLEIIEEDETKKLEPDEIAKMQEQFGAEVACEVAAKGGTYSDALEIAFKKQSEDIEALKQENLGLSEKLEHLSKLPDGKESAFNHAGETKKTTIYKRG